jgi:hypothetical protein
MDAKPMDAKTFEVMLDRLGTDFTRWPAADAEQAKKLLVHSADARQSYDTLLRVEALIDGSRPRIAPAHAHRVVHRALAEITRRDAAPPLLERFRLLLTAPLPRAAFAMSLTAIGFAVGIAVGNPTAEHPFDANGSAIMNTSVDDVLF